MSSDACLGDYLALQRGTTYKSARLDEPGPTLLGLASIERNGGFRRDRLRTYGGASPEKMLLQPGDLYVSLKDVTQAGDLLGAVARVPYDIQFGRLTQDTVKLEIKKTHAPDANYLYWLLRTPEYRAYCRAHSMGTTNLSLSRADFLAFSVPAVTRARTALVHALQMLDEKIDSNRRLAALLEETATTLFRARFVDFVGVEKFEETQIGRVPRGWQVGRLADLATVHKRSIDPSLTPDAEFHHFSIPAFDATHAGQIQVGRDMLSAKTSMPRGDCVLLSKLNPATRRVWWPRITGDAASVCSPEFLVLVPKDGVPNTYLYCVCANDERFYATLLGHATGTTGSRQRVKPADALRCPVVLPDRETLDLWDRSARPLFDHAHHLRSESSTLAAMRDVLLPKLSSGEIRVPDTNDAAEMIEAAAAA